MVGVEPHRTLAAAAPARHRCPWQRRGLGRYGATAAGVRRGRPLDIRWRFERREDLEAVVRIDFRPEIAEQVLASHPGVEVAYAVNLSSRGF